MSTLASPRRPLAAPPILPLFLAATHAEIFRPQIDLIVAGSDTIGTGRA